MPQRRVTTISRYSLGTSCERSPPLFMPLMRSVGSRSSSGAGRESGYDFGYRQPMRKGPRFRRPLNDWRSRQESNPQPPWFVVMHIGVFNQLILLVANAPRTNFRRYRSTSFSRRVAQKSRTRMRESRSANVATLRIYSHLGPMRSKRAAAFSFDQALAEGRGTSRRQNHHVSYPRFDLTARVRSRQPSSGRVGPSVVVGRR